MVKKTYKNYGKKTYKNYGKKTYKNYGKKTYENYGKKTYKKVVKSYREAHWRKIISKILVEIVVKKLFGRSELHE